MPAWEAAENGLGGLGMGHLLVSCGSCCDELPGMIFCEPPHDIKHHEADGAVSGATLLRFPLGVGNQVRKRCATAWRDARDEIGDGLGFARGRGGSRGR
jgi:hypothetical protein